MDRRTHIKVYLEYLLIRMGCISRSEPLRVGHKSRCDQSQGHGPVGGIVLEIDEACREVLPPTARASSSAAL